jgi:hypothetical protein
LSPLTTAILLLATSAAAYWLFLTLSAKRFSGHATDAMVHRRGKCSPTSAARRGDVAARVKAAADAYEAEALSYCLYVGSIEHCLATGKREEIYGRYGKTLARPTLSLAADTQPADFDALEKEIRWYMEASGFGWQQDSLPVSQLADSLYERAKAAAAVILKAI